MGSKAKCVVMDGYLHRSKSDAIHNTGISSTKLDKRIKDILDPTRVYLDIGDVPAGIQEYLKPEDHLFLTQQEFIKYLNESKITAVGGDYEIDHELFWISIHGYFICIDGTSDPRPVVIDSSGRYLSEEEMSNIIQDTVDEWPPQRSRDKKNAISNHPDTTKHLRDAYRANQKAKDQDVYLQFGDNSLLLNAGTNELIVRLDGKDSVTHSLSTYTAAILMFNDIVKELTNLAVKKSTVN